ncbi:MAG: glycosyltransferase, partial [Planctomycetota bacterium]
PEVGAALRRRYGRDNRSERTDTLFSLPVHSAPLAAHPVVRDADIVHLHWVANFLDGDGIAALADLGKPVVWTLHDEWAYTGGCHYAAGCTDFATGGCARCPQLREDPLGLVASAFARRADAFRSRAIRVVAPSRWLAERARESIVFRGQSVETIPYGLDIDVFAPPSNEDRSAFRRSIGVPEDAFVVAFGVDRIGERRKGAVDLLEALELARRGFPGIHLLRFGDASGSSKPAFPTIDLGPIADDRRLALAYGAADLFALPTLEDNLPNGVLESLACATPVVAYRTGGIPDVVTEGVEGFLAPTGRVEALACAIMRAAARGGDARALGWAGRARILAGHTLAAQARAYARLYGRLLANAGVEAAA